MAEWLVFYYRHHRKGDDGVERRDRITISSETEPTVEDIAEATGDTVLRLDGVEQIEEVESE